MPTRYSHSADTLCLSIRALRLSGEEASAHSGSFLSPGAARRTYVGWNCVRENRGPGEPWRLTFLPRVSLAFQTHLENQYCDLHCGSEFSVAATQKGWCLSVWLTHTAHFAEVMLCTIAGQERREWDLSRCQRFITASPKTWMEVHWLSASTHPRDSSCFILETMLIQYLPDCKALPRASAYFSLMALWDRQSTR